MAARDETVETVLIVDDEEPVRKTFQEWLESSGPGCRILTAADAEAALVLANQHTIDLAILDWNLGAGNDGLRLLEDLYLFNADVVAIMITGFAQQATPLDAMRMGVRDYLDKNQDLDRNSFLAAVNNQLERIRPLKRERRLHASLVAFREAVEKVLPLVQSAAAFNDPVPLPEAIRSLIRFLARLTGAADGVLLVRRYHAEQEPAEICRAYDAGGARLDTELAPFARSIAAAVLSLQEPHAINNLGQSVKQGAVELQPFERGKQALLAMPMTVAPGVQAVLELFDKKGGFTAEDQRLVSAAADFGTELLRQALTERQTHQLLFQAVEAALGASAHVAESLRGSASERQKQPPPAPVMDQLRKSLNANLGAAIDSTDTLRLAEAVRVLAVRHGPAAIQHCIQLVESLRGLLDTLTGAGETRP
jgi:two-component system, NtrC family, nitrogen regulation response regulator NtrX